MASTRGNLVIAARLAVTATLVATGVGGARETRTRVLTLKRRAPQR